MKKIFSLFAAVLMAVSVMAKTSSWVMNNDAGIAEITIVSQGATDTGGELELKKDGVVAASSKGYFKGSGTNGIQIYKTGTMSVTAPTGYVITSIVFQYPKDCYPFKEALPTGGSSTTKTSAQVDVTFTASTAAKSFTFTNEASGQTKVKKMTITMVPVITITTAQYATYYNATEAYEMPAGLEGITVEGVSGTNLTLNNTHYAAGSVVPAGEALVLHATEELTEATEFTLYAGTTSAEKISDNMLKGTSTAEEMTTGNAGDKYYRLSQHEGQVGFYWGAAEGAAFQPGANKAYLAVSGTNAPARFIFGQQDVPTELQNVSAENVSRKVMIDGRLYILRDGNMFDLNGRLVK